MIHLKTTRIMNIWFPNVSLSWGKVMLDFFLPGLINKGLTHMQCSWIQFSHLKYSNLLYLMLLLAGFVPWLQVSFCSLTICILMRLKSMSRTTNRLSSDVPPTLQPVYHKWWLLSFRLGWKVDKALIGGKTRHEINVHFIMLHFNEWSVLWLYI